LATRAQAKPESTAPPVRTVRVQQVRSTIGAADQTFTGVVRARHESDLSFRTGGKVVARLVEVGDRVRVGQVLARIDPGDDALAVREAEADMASAEASLHQVALDFDRTSKLVAANALAAAELDRVRADRDTAQARRARAQAGLRLANNRLGYATLTADSEGIVTSLLMEVGQVVAEGQVIARVARSGELEAVVSVPENRVASVRTGSASVSFWSLPGARHGAVLRELSPSADPVTRTYLARFTIRDAGPEIALGMTATIKLAPNDGSAGYTLPLSALLRNGTEPALWVVDRTSGHLALTTVNVREYRQESAIVTGGVNDGDLVVTAGVQKLDVSMTVRPWEAAL